MKPAGRTDLKADAVEVLGSTRWETFYNDLLTDEGQLIWRLDAENLFFFAVHFVKT